jgi:heme A synthase
MLLLAHSGVRYLVFLTGLLVVGYALFGLATKRPFDKTMRSLGSVFTGVMDLQVLLGVTLLVTGFGFYPALSGHIATMVLAAAVSHVVPAVMRRRPAERRSYGPYAVGASVALALVALGILSIGRPIVG